MEALIASEPDLQLSPIVQLKYSSSAPHQGKDIQPLQVLSG